MVNQNIPYQNGHNWGIHHFQRHPCYRNSTDDLFNSETLWNWRHVFQTWGTQKHPKSTMWLQLLYGSKLWESNFISGWGPFWGHSLERKAYSETKSSAGSELTRIPGGHGVTGTTGRSHSRSLLRRRPNICSSSHVGYSQKEYSLPQHATTIYCCCGFPLPISLDLPISSFRSRERPR